MGCNPSPGPLFTKRVDVVPQDLVKIGCFNDRIALKFDRHLDSTIAEVPVKFQSNLKRLDPNFTASSIHATLP